MTKFLKESELNSEIEKIIGNAEKQIILFSPYIKLHERIKHILTNKKNKPEVEIIIVFGKNEDNFSKSIKEEDYEFFKTFPNIQIKYEKRLHAKFYANENSSILTSMNLYSFSQDNNIEVGILSEGNFISGIAKNLISSVTKEDSFERQAWDYFVTVFQQAKLLYKREPIYEDGKLLGLIKKKYLNSKTSIDELSGFFASKPNQQTEQKQTTTTNQYFEETKANDKSNHKYQPKEIIESFVQSKPKGYCIRTGVEIDFNPEMPFCDSAYKSWASFGNSNYAEKYCHFSGEKAEGITKSKPILYKNWKVAKEVHNL